MRHVSLLVFCACAAASVKAQTPPPNCGAPNVFPSEGATRRLATLVAPDRETVRDPYESTAEWQDRAARARGDAQRTMLALLGSRRTLRTGGAVSVRYDADGERLILGEAPPGIAFPDIPYSLPRTEVVQGEADIVAQATTGLWGDNQIEPALDLTGRFPSLSLSRAQARAIDAATNPTCFFFVYRVFGNDAPVIGYDRIEIVSVVRGQPYVWSWTLGDDGTEGTEENRPPPLPPAPPPVGPLEFSEVQPELVGGIERLQSSIIYPSFERRAGVEGRVILRFVVGADGVPSNVRVVRAVSPGLDQEAIRLVQQSRWTPGRQNGQPVAVMFTLPVTFRIR